MSESDYWGALEFRVCHELEGMAKSNLRFLWCDGFVPEHCLLAGTSPRITGRAWIGEGPRQEPWEFTLIVNQPAASRTEIDWAALLPPRDVTEWLAVDLDRSHITIDLSEAVPDTAKADAASGHGAQGFAG